MSATTPQLPRTSESDARWTRVRDSGLAILAWLAIIWVICWALGHLTRALLILVLASLLAFAVTPAVRWLRRWMPGWLAITIVYLLALAFIGGLGFVIFSTAVAQLMSLARSLPSLLQPSTPGHPSPLVRAARPFGIGEAQVNAAREQMVAYLQQAAGSVAAHALPIITGVANTLLDLVLIVVLSIYLVADGPRVVAWIRTSSPNRLRARALFLVDVVQRNVGGYIRGQFLLCLLIGMLVGLGMAVFGVPYALLLGVLAFVLEFIPILGTLASGAICVLIALPTRGLLIAVLVLAYIIIVHVIEGDIVGPRIVGRVLGLHPVVAIIALVIGSELFGVWGVLFASPVAGVIQNIVVTAWGEWQATSGERVPAPAPAPSYPGPNRQRFPRLRWPSRGDRPSASGGDAEQTSALDNQRQRGMAT